MTTPVTQAEITGRIDELEAIVNGLMIYIAAREAGVDLDPEDPKTKEFLKKNVARPFDARLTRPVPGTGPTVKSADGFWDSLAPSKIPTLVKKLKQHFA
ncbi:hypothetical protein [Rhizobium rhizosphaerae]|uniref:hypothetical protein n=1 Tax=Xaviernesmea rhizosphaerae TaxID=1672749 RepID=UPI00111B04E4|nr:hypothetical protein [Xaviernesmea rhizosphaerae]